MYVNVDSTDVEIRNTARRISYSVGINMTDFVVQYLMLERRVLQLEASVADMAALRQRLARMEAGTPPHLSKVERRDTVASRA